MKGLFLKDFYNLRQLLLWYGVMMALFIAAAVISKNLSFMMGFGVFITISTASSSMAYDEKDNWYKFARACGLSPLAIAAEKYLLTLALGALSFALLAVCQAVIGEIDWMLNAGFFAINLMIGAVVFPVLFKFGVNRGRTWFTLLTVLIAGLMGGAGAASAGRFEGMERTGSHPAALTAVMAAFLAAALILTAFSARLSVRFYRKREF